MTEILNTNARILRVGPDGFSVPRGAICDSCGVKAICKPVSTPAACNEFSPLFVFRSPLIGFDGFFNTFRLGKGNFDRLKNRLGTVATLYEKRKGRILGRAKVTGLAYGPKEDMLTKYAHTNHLSIGRGVTKEEAPGYLRGVLEKNYKTMFKTADHNDPFAVIFMARIPEPVFNGIANPEASTAIAGAAK